MLGVLAATALLLAPVAPPMTRGATGRLASRAHTRAMADDNERQLRQALSEAADARNAESRLRTMIRAADEKACELQAEVAELQDELDALRLLTAQDEEALRDEIAELKESAGGDAELVRR